jgi:hypothetical protein
MILELNGKYILLLKADDVNLLGGNIKAINKKLLCASKESGLEVNAEKT